MEKLKDFLKNYLNEVQSKLSGRLMPNLRNRFKGKEQTCAEIIKFVNEYVPVFDYTKFCVAQHNEEGQFLVFYENKDDIGNLDKAVFAIKFESWEKLYEWWLLQSKMIVEINKHKS